MRRDDQARRLPQRIVRRQRLRFGHVDERAGQAAGFSNAADAQLLGNGVAAFGGAFLWMAGPAVNFLTASAVGAAGTIWFIVYGKDLPSGEAVAKGDGAG